VGGTFRRAQTGQFAVKRDLDLGKFLHGRFESCAIESACCHGRLKSRQWRSLASESARSNGTRIFEA
jgi:hypothetical protein